MSKNISTTPPHGEHVTEQLSAYMDDALDASAREAVRLHLTRCALCLAEHDELLATRDLMRSVPMIAPPRAFTLTQEMVAPARKKAGFWEQLLAPRNAPRLATGSAMAFALVLVLFVGNLALTNSTRGLMGAPSPAMSELSERESSAAGTGEEESVTGIVAGSEPSEQDTRAMAPPLMPTQNSVMTMTDAGDSTGATPAVEAGVNANPTPEAVVRGFASPEVNTKAAPPPDTGDGSPAADATAQASLAYSNTGVISNYNEAEDTAREVGRVQNQQAEGPAYLPQQSRPTSNPPDAGIDMLTLALALLLSLGILLALGALAARRRVSQ